jgi:hypothetical protein
VRSDFQAALSQVLSDVAAHGAALLLLGTAPPLPSASPGATTEPNMARVLAAGSVPVAPDDWEALECDATTCMATAVPATALVDVEAMLAGAGFHRAPPVPVSATNAEPAWARFEDRTGLVAGLTRLGDELSVLYAPATIAASIFTKRLGWIWNGSAFV